MSQPPLDSVLRHVQRPGRYVDGEWNAVHKPWDDASVRVAICYLDIYEVGMSSLMMQSLYRRLNDRPETLCERAFLPWGDMAAAIRAAHLPLYTLESRRPLREFDALFFVASRELEYPHLLECLDLAGLPLRAAERKDGPIVVLVAPDVRNPEPIGDFVDAALLGNVEAGAGALLDALQATTDREDLVRRGTALPGVYVPSRYAKTPVGIQPLCKDAPDRIDRRREFGAPLVSQVVPYLEATTDRGLIEAARRCGDCASCRDGQRCLSPVWRSTADLTQAVEVILASCGYREFALLGPPVPDYASALEAARTLRAKYPINELALFLPPLALDLTLDEASHRAQTERLQRSAEAIMALGWYGVRLHVVLGDPHQTADTTERVLDVVDGLYALGRRLAERRPRVRVHVDHYLAAPWTADAQPVSLEWLTVEQGALRKGLRRAGVVVSLAEPEAIVAEAALAYQSRDGAALVERLWRAGCRWDGWTQRFESVRWFETLRAGGVDPAKPLAAPGFRAPWTSLGVDSASPCALEPCPNCGWRTTTPSASRPQ
ncbi:MAG: hypothetical protein HY261_05190 [Chloroflexi bacterium]|nr:hypothetical protein [Chloroflexota bacterium]